MGWGNWRRKLERLDRILALWEGRESELAALDLTPRRAAVVQTRRGAPPAWTRGREPGMEI
jgi:hypothetical protein